MWPNCRANSSCCVRPGIRPKMRCGVFHFAQMALGILGLLAGVYVNLTVLGGGEGMSTQKMMIYTIGPGGIGYMLAQVLGDPPGRRAQRGNHIGFPGCAGHDAGLCRSGPVAGSMYCPRGQGIACQLYKALADEFEVVAYEMKAGKDKVTVLNDMGERCGVQDVSSFVTVLVQSASFGTSIADALAGLCRLKCVTNA